MEPSRHRSSFAVGEYVAPHRTELAAQGEAAADSVLMVSWGHLILGCDNSTAQKSGGIKSQVETHRYFLIYRYEHGATPTTAAAYRRQDQHFRRWEGAGI